MRDLIKIVEGFDDEDDMILWHGTSEPADTVMRMGLVPGRHGAVFLTDNPELALEYAVTDQDRTGNDDVTLVSVRVSDLDAGKLVGDIDHTTSDGWRDSLRETDQCMYMGAIPAAVLTVETH